MCTCIQCEWLLLSERLITLSLVTYDLESGYDFVRVFDGVDVDGKLLKEVSGVDNPWSPPEVVIEHGPLFVIDYCCMHGCDDVGTRLVARFE